MRHGWRRRTTLLARSDISEGTVPINEKLGSGWDTLRSMIVGWSTKVDRSEITANER
jgi:hypothetical protein